MGVWMDVVGHGIHVDGMVAVDEEVDNTGALDIDLDIDLDIFDVVDEEVDNMISAALVNPEQYRRWVGTSVSSRISHSHSPSRFS